MKKFLTIGFLFLAVSFLVGFSGMKIFRNHDGTTTLKVNNLNTGDKALSGTWLVNNADEYVGFYKAGTNHSQYPSDCLFINNKGDFVIMNNNATAKEFKWYQATTVQMDADDSITNISGTNQVLCIDANGDLNILTGSLDLAGISEPGADSGVGKIYMKSANSNLYFKNEGGSEFQLGSAVDIVNYTAQNGTKVLDIDGAGVQTYTLDGNITFSSVNNLSSTISKSISVYIIDDGNERTVSFNASWLWVGTTPTTMGSNATGLLLLTTKGNSQSDVVASYEETQ